jgi:hypothetical protein
MNWFLVAIMSLVYQGGEKDMFIWSTPTFETLEECTTFVQTRPADIYLTLKNEFPNDSLDRLLCVERERLKRFIEATPSNRQGA